MSRQSLQLTPALYEYLLSVGVRETPIQRRLREETAGLPLARMQISPEQAQFMALLIRLMGAGLILEVGTFTGYSALSMAQALPPGGKLITCDISEEWTSVARRYWEEAGVAEAIELLLGPAERTLEGLAAGPQAGRFDFAFIDADKRNYEVYYERALELLRPGGLIAIDNVLWSGAVADPARNDPDTQAIRALNQKLHADPRIDLCLVPIGDGLSLARRR